MMGLQTITGRRWSFPLSRAVMTALWIAACAGGEPARPSIPRDMAVVDGGALRIGSDSLERELGYELSPPLVREQRWYDRWEIDPSEVAIRPFALDRHAVTQGEYAEFVAATGRSSPIIDSLGWLEQGFLAHSWDEVRPYLWAGGEPSPAVIDHPVVLVTLADAESYCDWRGERIGRPLRLPTEIEFEAACRGREGRTFPWGGEWREGATRAGADGTGPVDGYPLGVTPSGIFELGGNVFEWTSSTMPDGRPVLKGCGWDDAPGTCRCAFRHGRPPGSRHILIGFRCAVDL
jgi:formylglycine-generating enzyme required for sulfatase activity